MILKPKQSGTKMYNHFNRLDPKFFKAFIAAAEHENFTLAAKAAALTQSGVSQQVARLEEQLDIKLFQRVNKAVHLTNAGRQLVHYINSYLDRMDLFLAEIKEKNANIKGTVSYSMPNSCLLSPHLSLLLDKKISEPNLILDIQIDPNKKVYEKVLNNVVDFGFVTNKKENPALEHIFFCQEEFALVGGKKFKNIQINMNAIKNTSFINFEGMEDYFESWLRKYFPKTRGFNSSFLNYSSKISHLHGVITLLKKNIGIAVLPKHCVEKELKKNELFLLDHDDLERKVENDIYIVKLKNQHTPNRTQKVIDWFLELKD